MLLDLLPTVAALVGWWIVGKHATLGVPDLDERAAHRFSRWHTCGAVGVGALAALSVVTALAATAWTGRLTEAAFVVAGGVLAVKLWRLSRLERDHATALAADRDTPDAERLP